MVLVWVMTHSFSYGEEEEVCVGKLVIKHHFYLHFLHLFLFLFPFLFHFSFHLVGVGVRGIEF